MEPCRTPKIISDPKLYVPFNFTLCFPLVKYECKSFKEGISAPEALSLAINSSRGKQSNVLERSLVELQRHSLCREILGKQSNVLERSLVELQRHSLCREIFQALGVRRWE